jgi:hypothetical protein
MELDVPMKRWYTAGMGGSPMDRKEFLRNTCQCGLGAAALGMMSATRAFAEDPKPPAAENLDKDAAFRVLWLQNMLATLEAQLDEPTRIRFMEGCGRSCAKLGAIKAAQAAKGDVDALIKTLQSWVGPENVRRDGKEIHLSYSTCLCHLVAKAPERLPDLYCHCSRGWVLEMFETVLGKPVKVELLESIKRGGKRCHFVVRST